MSQHRCLDAARPVLQRRTAVLAVFQSGSWPAAEYWGQAWALTLGCVALERSTVTIAMIE